MFHTFTLYDHFKFWGLMIKTSFLQYTRPYIERVEAKILYGQRLGC